MDTRTRIAVLLVAVILGGNHASTRIQKKSASSRTRRGRTAPPPRAPMATSTIPEPTTPASPAADTGRGARRTSRSQPRHRRPATSSSRRRCSASEFRGKAPSYARSP